MTNQDIIKQTLEELDKDSEWKMRYAKYAKEILNKQNTYVEMSRKVKVSFPLSMYTTISKIKSGNYQYDIRYFGQSIGTLEIKKGQSKPVFRCSSGYENLRNRKELENLPKLNDKDGEEWNSVNMRRLRSILKKQEVVNATIHSPEHKCENLLLREFSKLKSKGKSFLNIQPIKLGGKLFFQLTTCLSASKPDTVAYSEGRGGGIDILARVGTGKNSHLCVFELKDENLTSEPMEIVLQQALKYAVFLACLLTKGGEEDNERIENWWKILGYNGKNKPNVIDVVGIMPKGAEVDCKYCYEVGSFTLNLYTLYFDKEALYQGKPFEFSGSYAKIGSNDRS